MNKLKEGLSVIRPEDTTILLGDLSWALDLQEAQADFAWIDQIPGKKILLKGNHDYWWSTATKFYKFCEDNGFSNQWILNNNHYEYDGYAVCGTRGWFYEEDRSGEHDEKVFKREMLRLESSLISAGDQPKIVFLHYPPRYKGYTCTEILDLFKKYDVRKCYYGHLHGASHGLAMEGVWDGIDFKLVAADKLDFKPYMVLP
jgi:predicted phosphohydrolase